MAFSFPGQHEPIHSLWEEELHFALFHISIGFHCDQMTTLVYNHLITVIDICHIIPLGETLCLNNFF